MSLIDRLAALVGPGHCLHDSHDIAPYLTEERGLYHGRALAVVRPGSTAELARAVALCAGERIAVVPQGGNTGLCGGGVPPEHGRAVVVSTERLTRVRAVDPVNFTMTVEAGCILADIQRQADEAGCLFPLSLAAEGSCRIGGNLATNAGGLNVLRYGTARDLVLGLEVVLADGRIWNGLKALRKDNTGYDLKQLFIGSEGTLGIIAAATLKLFPRPRESVTALVALADPEAALDLLFRLRQASGDCVTACELIPRIGLDLVFAQIPGPRDPFDRPHPWYVLLELSSSRPGGLAETMETVLADAIEAGRAVDAVVAASLDQRQALWQLRERIPEAEKRAGGGIKHDVAVATSRVPELIRRATEAVAAAMPGVRTIAFGHLGDGNVHFNLIRPLDAEPAWFLAQWSRMNQVVHDVVTALDGSISAEHGIGRLKTGELARVKPAIDLELMRRIKTALDPVGILNPGKVLA